MSKDSPAMDPGKPSRAHEQYGMGPPAGLPEPSRSEILENGIRKPGNEAVRPVRRLQYLALLSGADKESGRTVPLPNVGQP
eukprot:11438840-Heterocapsa_arctica.AAC.1